MAQFLVRKEHEARYTRTTRYEAEIEVADDDDVEAAMRRVRYSAWEEVDQWDELDGDEGDTYEVVERLDVDDETPRGTPADFGVAQVELF